MKTLEDALAAIEEMKAAHEAEKTAILNKNKELVEREKAAKAAADAAKEAADEAAAEKEREGKDIAAIEKRLADKHAKEVAKLQADIQARDARLSTLLIDNALSANLVKAGIDPDHHEILMAAFKNKATLDGDRAVIDGVEIEQFVTDFAASDRGKKYIPAPANSGANATGSRTVGNTLPETWSLDAYAKLKTENPQAAVSYAAKHGRNFGDA